MIGVCKEELERKMQVQELDARVHGGVKEISEQINPQVGQPPTSSIRSPRWIASF